MDAVMASDRDGNWVKISLSPIDKEESPFWSSTEKKPKKQQEKMKSVQQTASPNIEASRGTPSTARRDKVR